MNDRQLARLPERHERAHPRIQTEKAVEIDRRSYQGPVSLRWSGPKELRVSPAGPSKVMA